MTRAERVLARRWRTVLLACVLVALSGAVLLIWAKVDHEISTRKEAISEANKRGSAVSTLAGDVRALRAQVQSKGGTPVAPDPSKAIANLPDRTEVPVPIPGPPGPKGDPGPSASPGATGPAGSPGANSTVPGPEGSPGVAGTQGDPGPAGPAGQDGKDGTDGKDGSNGSPPAGWTYTDPAGIEYSCSPVDGFDPSSPQYACSPQAATPPAQSTDRGGLLGIGMLATSAAYRRL